MRGVASPREMDQAAQARCPLGRKEGPCTGAAGPPPLRGGRQAGAVSTPQWDGPAARLVVPATPRAAVPPRHLLGASLPGPLHRVAVPPHAPADQRPVSPLSLAARLASGVGLLEEAAGEPRHCGRAVARFPRYLRHFLVDSVVRVGRRAARRSAVGVGSKRERAAMMVTLRLRSGCRSRAQALTGKIVRK